MTDFADLSRAEQIDRLKSLGRHALTQYGVEPGSMTSLVHAENTTFRVESGNETFCLRIHRPGYQTVASTRSELQWLASIRHGTRLQVPDPVVALDGSLVVVATDDGVPEPRHCVLFRWLHGQFLKELTVTREHFFAVGSALAQLHDFTGSWILPADFARPNLEEVSIFRPGQGTELAGSANEILTSSEWSEISSIGEEFPRVLRSIGRGPDDYGLIHADLHRGNFLFEGDQIKLIDFDDCAFAPYAYDFVPLLAFQIQQPDYLDQREAVFAGYESVRPLPPHTRELIRPLIRWRGYGFVRWVLDRSDNPGIREQARELIDVTMDILSLADRYEA